MGNVMVIPARRQVGNTVKQSAQKKLRVAAYCRVSTDSEEQETSYEAQVTHYTEYIQKNPEWELAGIFADDGISGTNTKKRDEFNRMIDECMAGNIDMVITKSISRFARNTLDCLQYIRQLKDKNIPVYFEKEAINTLDAKGEVLITIMASLAQQESQSMSQNIKLGLQYRYQQGKVQVNHNRFLGYTKDDNGHLIIDPEQAEIVKRIYREYLEGSSMDKIAYGLMADGILTGAGKTKWHTSTINKILRNEKYMGDALLQKTYTTDFLTETAENFTGASTGTTTAASPLSGAVSVAWSLPPLKRTAPTGRLTSSCCRKSRSRPSIRFLPSGTYFLKPYSRTSPRPWSTLTPSHRTAFRQGLKNFKKSSSRRQTTSRTMTPSPMRFSGYATRRNNPSSTATTGKKP